MELFTLKDELKLKDNYYVGLLIRGLRYS